MFRIIVPSAEDIQKSRFLIQIQDMDQNSFFSCTIEREAIQARADAHHQKSLCGKPVALKTT